MAQGVICLSRIGDKTLKMNGLHANNPVAIRTNAAPGWAARPLIAENAVLGGSGPRNQPLTQFATAAAASHAAAAPHAPAAVAINIGEVACLAIVGKRVQSGLEKAPPPKTTHPG